MPRPGEVLVAIMRDRLDFRLLRDELWYRIPVPVAEGRLLSRWPPEWLAFYQTKIFGTQAYSLRYFGRVVEIRRRNRQDLFPDEPSDEKSFREYYQVLLDGLRELPRPIPSKRLRRITFIPTTWQKLVSAVEVNDLFDESPLEDELWDHLKDNGIEAERQHLVEVGERSYFLDFAIYCSAGKLDVETDGDAWHANPASAAKDNERDNDLHAAGWTSLRFSSMQLRERIEEYCVPQVAKAINAMGGVAWTDFPRFVPYKNQDGSYQLDLFGHLGES